MQAWQRSDTEAVACCLCRRAGRPVFDLDPFGVVRCPACELVFVSPRLHPQAQQWLYADVSYHEEGIYGGHRRHRAAMALQRCWSAGRLSLVRAETGPDAAGRTMLEVGCAYGLFLDAARARGYAVTGVELSAAAAGHARAQFGLTVHAGQLADAPLAGGGFDVICAWDTLEHVPDPLVFWKQVRALLAADGVVLFSTPNFASVPARLFGRRWWTLKPAEHIWHFTPATHRAVAERAGMRITGFVRNPLRRANFARLDSLVGIARPA